MMKKNSVLISAGGTGGHLIPAQQLAKKLISEEDASVVFVAKGLSKNRNFRNEIFDYKDVESGPLNPKKIFISLFSIMIGTVRSMVHILQKKVDIIVGFGSYHTFPVLLAGYLLRKPIIVFESNSYLGRVNRFFAKRAKVVATQFELKDQKKYKNFKLVPLLPWIAPEAKIEKNEARDKLNLNSDHFTFLVFGGSLGATFINEVFLDAAKDIIKEGSFQVIHLCGDKSKLHEIKSFYDNLGVVSYVSAYEIDMMPVYSAADLVICRAGAATISELIFFELPSILIPYPFSSEDHQKSNAFYLKDSVGGAEVFLQNEFEYQAFVRFLLDATIFKTKKLIKMKNNLSNFKGLLKKENRPDLSKIICEVLKNL